MKEIKIGKETERKLEGCRVLIEAHLKKRITYNQTIDLLVNMYYDVTKE